MSVSVTQFPNPCRGGDLRQPHPSQICIPIQNALDVSGAETQSWFSKETLWVENGEPTEDDPRKKERHIERKKKANPVLIPSMLKRPVLNPM